MNPLPYNFQSDATGSNSSECDDGEKLEQDGTKKKGVGFGCVITDADYAIIPSKSNNSTSPSHTTESVIAMSAHQNYYNPNMMNSGGQQHHHQQNQPHHQQQLAPRPPINEDFQKQVQQDWANREYIEVISGSIKRIADFLNSFDLSCRYRLTQLNEKLTSLERKIEVLEAWISKGETLP